MQNTHFLRDYKALRIIFILIFTLFSLNSYSHSGASHEDEEVNTSTEQNWRFGTFRADVQPDGMR